MKLVELKSGLVSFGGALVASVCCLLPLTVVLLGLGSGAFMVTTMQFRPLFLPLGILGVGLGYYLYFLQWRRCNALGCRMAGSKINLILLAVATVMLTIELIFVAFPDALWSLLMEGHQ
ncbi:MAG: hypothetical protein L0191_17110 [Acidobacteria bacterium]|nr:hypothetical protein [Acidobacteriota bacterium]